jgi:uncharacterized protein YjdB
MEVDEVKNYGRSRRFFIALAVTGALVLTLCVPMSVFAANWSDLSNTVASAPQMTLGQAAAFGAQQPDADNYYQFQKLWKKFTIAQPSVVTVKVDAAAQAGFAGAFPNGLEVSVWGGTNASQFAIKDVSKAFSGGAHIKVRTDEDVTKSAQFKLMPGTYYVQGYEWTSNVNGYGNVTVTAQTAAGDAEPNDTKLLAKGASLNVQYAGLLNWWLPAEDATTGRTEDFYDYYKFTVPNDDQGVRLTFSRTQDGVSRNITASVVPGSGSVSDGTIGLKDVYSASKAWKLAKGTYYVYVNGWQADYGDATEYTFKLTSFSLSVPAARSVDVGKWFSLGAKAVPAAALTYTSSNNAVASVDLYGKVTGRKAGKAVITVTAGGDGAFSKACAVTVSQPLGKIALNKTKLTLKRGKSFTLKVKKWTPTNVSAQYKKLKFKSSKPKVASVSGKGVVKAKKKGKAVVTVTDSNGRKYSCRVTVK